MRTCSLRVGLPLVAAVALMALLCLQPARCFVFRDGGHTFRPSKTRCGLHMLRLRVHPPPSYPGLCFPNTTLTPGCRGSCHSYARVDTYNATQIQRSCSCCTPTRWIPQPVEVHCADGHKFRQLVKVVRGCSCRPCFVSTKVKNIVHLRELLDKAALPFRL